MREFKKCQTCKDYHYIDEKCDPEYFVFYEDYMGDESKSIRAHNHEGAAVKFAQYYNEEGDYQLMNDNIEVKVVKDGVEKFFVVGAEPDVHYSSKEINELTK